MRAEKGGGGESRVSSFNAKSDANQNGISTLEFSGSYIYANTIIDVCSILLNYISITVTAQEAVSWHLVCEGHWYSLSYEIERVRDLKYSKNKWNEQR